MNTTKSNFSKMSRENFFNCSGFVFSLFVAGLCFFVIIEACGQGKGKSQGGSSATTPTENPVVSSSPIISKNSASGHEALIGAYYTPWLVSEGNSYYIVNGVETGAGPEFYVKSTLQSVAEQAFNADGTSSGVITPAPFAVTALNGSSIPFIGWESEYLTLIGMRDPQGNVFSNATVKNASLSSVQNFSFPSLAPWDSVQQIIALKQYWKDNQNVTGYDGFVTNSAVFPAPASESAGGLGYYSAEDAQTVSKQKQMAADAGIDFLGLEMYWNYGTYNNTDGVTLENMTQPIDVFFSGTAQAGNLKLALIWIFMDTVYSNETAPYLPADKQFVFTADMTAESMSAACLKFAPYLKNSQYLLIDGKPVFYIMGLGAMYNKYVPDTDQDDFGTFFNKYFTTCLATNSGFSSVSIVEMYPYQDQSIPAGVRATAGITGVTSWGPEWYNAKNYTEYSKNLTTAWNSVATDFAGLQIVPGVDVAEHPETVHIAGSAYYRQDRALNASNNNGGYATDGSVRREDPSGDLNNGSTPAKFQSNLQTAQSWAVTQKQPGTKSMFVLTWNDWPEGSALEPTTLYGCAYLDAIKNIGSNNTLETSCGQNP